MTPIIGQPPGRSGKLWLQRRISIAEHGASRLEHKLQLLQRAYGNWTQRQPAAVQAWHDACQAAELWWLRACIADGRETTERLGRGRVVELGVTPVTTAGRRHPGGAACGFDPGEVEPPVLSTALLQALPALEAAVRAAAELAVVDAARAALAAEIAVTQRRIRALRIRLLPQARSALAAVDLELEEAEHGDAVRVRRAAGAGRRP